MRKNWRAALSAVSGCDAVSLDIKEWDAARVGKVHDMDTGALVVDLTPERMRSVVKAYEFQKARGIRVPFDFDHGTRRFPGDPVRGQVYGVTGAVSFDEDAGKLRVQPGMNGKGRTLIGDDDSSYALSPVFAGPLFDPKTGEQVSDCYIESIALTALPRQDGLDPVSLGKGDDPVMLARFDSAAEVDDFSRALESGARTLLQSMGHSLDWSHIKDWSGDDAGTLAATFWVGEDHHLFICDWSRAEDGAVTVTNARPGEAVTTYIETQPTEAAVALGKQEAHMRNINIRALACALAAADLVDGVELSKGESLDVEVPEKVADAFDAIAGKAEALTAELSKVRADLIKAEARVEQSASEAGQVAELSKRVDQLVSEAAAKDEAIKAERLALEADKWAASLGKSGRISEGRIDPESGARVDDKRVEWAKRYVALGKDEAQALADELTKPGTFAPVALGRGVGLEGEPVRKVEDDGQSDIDAAREAGMSVAAYMLSKKGGN